MAGSRRHQRHSHSARPIRRATDRPVLEEPAQVVGQVFRAGVPLARVLFEAFQADGLEFAREVALQAARRQRVLLGRLAEGRQRRRALEWRPPGEHLVEDRAQGVDVGGGGDVRGRAAGLLGGHVAGRPHDVARPRQAGLALHQLGQAEVGDLRDALLGQHDVGRLEVAMDDPVLVGVMQGAGQLLDELRGLPAAAAGLPPSFCCRLPPEAYSRTR